MRLAPGSRVKFIGERLRYTVKASNERFAVCTKPFNLRHTVLYTIIDFERAVRGPENLVFGMGFETDRQCVDGLERLVKGESQVSSRHCLPLEIEEITT